MCIGGGGGAAKASAQLQQKQADDARADAAAKATSLKTGMGNIDTAFGGFDDNYFAKLQQNYTDYAMPQFQDQYDDARKNIVYALARKGNLNSSVAGDQYNLLNKEAAKNIVGIQGVGADIAGQARRDVQANKQDVIGQLNASYDADAANTAALSAAKALAVPQSFSPLGELFTNISALAAQNKIASDSNPDNYGVYGARNYGKSPSVSYARA